MRINVHCVAFCCYCAVELREIMNYKWLFSIIMPFIKLPCWLTLKDADNVSTEFEFKSSPSTQLRALECNGVHLRLLYQMQLFINLLFHVCRYSPWEWQGFSVYHQNYDVIRNKFPHVAERHDTIRHDTEYFGPPITEQFMLMLS